MKSVFRPDQTVVFAGDSITNAGRDRSDLASLGDGYVARVAERLRQHGPSPRLINAGVSGDTTRHLLERWERDVLAHRPDWISIAIGVNDVWRSFGMGDPADAVGPEEFEANYQALLERSAGAQLILVEPFVIEPNGDDPLRSRVSEYAGVVERLARAFSAVFVPFQRAFDRMSTIPSSAWSPDRVHPNAAGTALLASEYLAAVGVAVFEDDD